MKIFTVNRFLAFKFYDGLETFFAFDLHMGDFSGRADMIYPRKRVSVVFFEVAEIFRLRLFHFNFPLIRLLRFVYCEFLKQTGRNEDRHCRAGSTGPCGYRTPRLVFVSACTGVCACMLCRNYVDILRKNRTGRAIAGHLARPAGVAILRPATQLHFLEAGAGFEPAWIWI